MQMPHSTVKYPFEGRVLSGLAALGEQLLNSSDQGFGYVATFDAEARMVSWYPETSYSNFRDFRSDKTPCLFYDPFDQPEYRYISWNSISKQHMERILDIKFEDNDFKEFFGERIIEFPDSWGVMF